MLSGRLIVYDIVEDVVIRVLALNHPDAADAADEIERLREQNLQLNAKIERLLREDDRGQHCN